MYVKTVVYAHSKYSFTGRWDNVRCGNSELADHVQIGKSLAKYLLLAKSAVWFVVPNPIEVIWLIDRQLVIPLGVYTPAWVHRSQEA